MTILGKIPQPAHLTARNVSFIIRGGSKVFLLKIPRSEMMEIRVRAVVFQIKLPDVF